MDERARAFLLSLFEAPWMLEPRYGQRLQQLALRLLRGETAAEAELRALFESRRDRGAGRGPAYEDDDDYDSPSPGIRRATRERQKEYTVKGTVAVIPIRGVLFKSDAEAWWYGGTSYAKLRRAIAAAGADGAVRSILLRVDSPGGAAIPVETAAAEIFTLGRDTAKGKPVWAFGEDGYVASAAYYLASQCNRIVLTPGAWMGSIGTIMLVPEYSRLLDEIGIVVNIIKSTPTKDIGTPYRPMTEKDRQFLQSDVDTYDAQFVAAVARGRGVSESVVRAWQKGRGYIGKDAVEAGLADGVRNSAEQVIAEMERAYGGGSGAVGVRGEAGDKAGAGEAGGVAAVGVGTQAPDAVSGAQAPAAPETDTDTHNRGIQDMAAEAKNTGDGSDSKAGGGTGAATATAEPPAAPAVHTEGTVQNRDQIEAERKRVLAITQRAERARVEGVDQLRDQAIEQGWSPDRFGARLFDLLAEKCGPAGRGPEQDTSNRARRRDGIAMVLMARTTPNLIPALEEGGERAIRMARAAGFDDPASALACWREACSNGLRSQSLLYIAQSMVATARSVSIERVMAMNPTEFMAAAFMGSSDFPALLSNVANKSLLAAFNETPVVWTRCCSRGTAVDYKERDIASLSEAPNFELIIEGKTPSEGRFGDRKESIKVAPYGKRFSFTYQMLRNDDLGAFARFTQLVGQAGRRVPEDAFFRLLALNGGLGPTMSDGKSMCHADHNNITDGSALTYAELQEDFTTMKSQKGFGEDRAPLDIVPRVLLVPLPLEWMARSIAQNQWVPGTPSSPSSATEQNLLQGLFEPVASPRLEGTRRYLFADPGSTPAIQVDFLDGQETPEITIIPDGDPMSQRFQATIRGFGIAAVQYEAILTNAGTSNGG